MSVTIFTIAVIILQQFFNSLHEVDMQATVKWVDGAQFLGESGSGHAVLMDGPVDHGGRNTGVRARQVARIRVGDHLAARRDLGNGPARAGTRLVAPRIFHTVALRRR